MVVCCCSSVFVPVCRPPNDALLAECELSFPEPPRARPPPRRAGRGCTLSTRYDMHAALTRAFRASCCGAVCALPCPCRPLPSPKCENWRIHDALVERPVRTAGGNRGRLGPPWLSALAFRDGRPATTACGGYLMHACIRAARHASRSRCTHSLSFFGFLNLSCPLFPLWPAHVCLCACFASLLDSALHASAFPAVLPCAAAA